MKSITDQKEIEKIKENVKELSSYTSFLTILEQTPESVEYFSVDPGEFIFKENDLYDDLYFLVEGFVDSYHSGIDDTPVKIHSYTQGMFLGEVDFIDEIPRINSVISKTPVIIIKISSHIKSKSPTLSNMLIKDLMPLYGIKIRKIHKEYVKQMQERILLYKTQIKMGHLIVYIIMALSLFSFVSSIFHTTLTTARNPTYVTLPITFIGIIFLITMYKFMELPLSAYGLHLKGAKKTLKDTLLYCIPFCLLVLVVKWFMIHYNASFIGEELFRPYAGIKPETFEHPRMAWIFSILLYGGLVCPLQELLTRSGLQTPLTQLLTGRYKIAVAILASNMMFMTGHLVISPTIALLTFVPGLFFGWLFYKYDSIIAPLTAHIIIGVWSLNIVGFTLI